MEKFKHLQRIKEIYAKGENIIQYLKNISKSESNSIEDILISYDFQAGSYIQHFAKNSEYVNNYSRALAKVIDSLGNFNSIVEIGVGEATTLGMVIKKLKNRPENILGFDISWSRLKFAKEFLNDLNLNNINLFTANLFEIPLMDNSIDIVYTSHSIEPNGGKEVEALTELYRITNKYLVLLEPSFELGNDAAKARMKQHGYVTKLYETAQKLDYKIIEHRLFDFCANPLNPTGLIIIEKKADNSHEPGLVCPITKTPLKKYNDALLYSKDSFLAYPVIDNIPCLLKENSVLATHLLTNYKEFKAERNIVIE